MSRLISIFLGGGLGAVSRFLVTQIVAARIPGEFPMGTLAVNVTGSFAMGFIVHSLQKGLWVGGDEFPFEQPALVGGYPRGHVALRQDSWRKVLDPPSRAATWGEDGVRDFSWPRPLAGDGPPLRRRRRKPNRPRCGNCRSLDRRKRRTQAFPSLRQFRTRSRNPGTRPW